MPTDAPTWPPPSGCPVGTSGWYLASDGEWYTSSAPPAPGYLLDHSGRWEPIADADVAARDEAWRWSNWGLGEVGWGALVFVVASIVGAVALVVVTGDTDRLDDAEFGVYTNAAFIALNAVALAGLPWWATRRKGLRSLRLDFGFRGRATDIAIGFGIGIAGLFAAGLVAAAVDAAFGVEESTTNIPVEQLAGAGEIVAFAAAAAVITPIVEELFFRGLVYRSFLKRGTSVRVSIAATTGIFTIPHLLAADSVASLATIAATITVLGLAFNLACHWTHNRLAAPITAHAVVNGVAVLALALS